MLFRSVNTGDTFQNVTLIFDGMKRNDSFSGIKVTQLSSDDILTDNVPHDNLLIQKESIVPVYSGQRVDGKELSLVIAPHTFAVYRFVR